MKTDKEFNELQNLWKKERVILSTNTTEVETSLTSIKKLLSFNEKFQYGNVIVLAISTLCLCLFFYFLAPVQTILSRIAALVMILGLLLRTMIEYQSIRKFQKVSYQEATIVTNQKFLSYYKYRSNIHGPITLLILLSYVISAFLLIPEFSGYFTSFTLSVFYGAFLISMLVFGWIVRKNIQKELKNLNQVLTLQQEISGN